MILVNLFVRLAKIIQQLQGRLNDWWPGLNDKVFVLSVMVSFACR